ncbi:MAG: hypothetical protein ED557_03855 [Balneola sp.]|nr:MAG: hypothetical protein ED557_03855 [Balneola sp.]
MFHLSTNLLILYLLFIQACTTEQTSNESEIDYQKEMRTFVQEISTYAREQNPDFIVIPQNGHRLVSDNGLWNGNPDTSYLNSIDGLGQESLYYGNKGDDLNTSKEMIDYLEFYLDIGKQFGKTVLTTDYTFTPSKMDSSFIRNLQKGYVSFAADRRALDNIPLYPENISNENSTSVKKLSDAKNFLYLINPGAYSSKEEFIADISGTNYDAVIIDAFYLGTLLTKTDIDQLKTKANGGSRLVISYMSIGEAETYRYYWDETWTPGNPEWIVEENPNWPENYKVEYWNKEWKKVIYGTESSYLQKILDSGFDGVYLDIIDGFEYFMGLH